MENALDPAAPRAIPHRIEPLNLPFGFAFLINFMLASERCTSDHLLITADAADEMIGALDKDSHFAPALAAVSVKLREWAPLYVHARGKMLGDFEGTLSP